MPVTESLAHGKPCLVARTTSLPEAGGALARYFDPDNLRDAVEAVRILIEDRAGLAAWEMEVRTGFQRDLLAGDGDGGAGRHGENCSPALTRTEGPA